MIEFTSKTPTISQIYQYTYSNPSVWNRFEYADRDVLKTKIKIERRLVYRKNKEGKYSTLDERLIIHTESFPNYPPYSYIKTKGAKKQRKIRHEYTATYCISKDENGNYNYWTSKIRWHLGSFRKWVDRPPQSKIKSIYRETYARLERKYRKLTPIKRKEMIRREVEHIKKRATYLDVGDWNSRVNGLMGDFVFRVAPLQLKFDCGYGRIWYTDLPKGENSPQFPFFTKHDIKIIGYLLRYGILKYK